MRGSTDWLGVFIRKSSKCAHMAAAAPREPRLYILPPVVSPIIEHLIESSRVTTGILTMHPMPGSASISMVNIGLEGFAAALEMPRNLRVNAVSPPWVKETMAKLGMDPTSGLASAEVAKAYVAAVEGSHQGVILDPHHLGK